MSAKATLPPMKEVNEALEIIAATTKYFLENPGNGGYQRAATIVLICHHMSDLLKRVIEIQ